VSPLNGPVGLISNPYSGHNRDQFQAIAQRIDACNDIHHVITHSPDDIDRALRELATHNISLLAINGGDGTASAILGRMLELDLFNPTPTIALLPGGTANMNAGDIGIKGALQKAVARFTAWCDGPRETTGKLQQRALIKLAPDGQSAPHYTMFLGGGAVIQGSEYAHAEIHSRGLRDDFSLALGTLRTIWGVVRDDPAFNQHVSIEISMDGGEVARYDTLILAISTLKRLAFGMNPFWSDEPGAIRITVMEQGCTRFGRTFFSIARGRPSRNAVPASGYRSHNADQIALTMQGKLNLDGEIIDVDGAVTISATKALEFLVL
jgi:diacylglycerol kinase (ATP)